MGSSCPLGSKSEHRFCFILPTCTASSIETKFFVIISSCHHIKNFSFLFHNIDSMGAYVFKRVLGEETLLNDENFASVYIFFYPRNRSNGFTCCNTFL